MGLDFFFGQFIQTILLKPGLCFRTAEALSGYV